MILALMEDVLGVLIPKLALQGFLLILLIFKVFGTIMSNVSVGVPRAILHEVLSA